VNPALLRLLLDSVRGRLLRGARLVRQPRYLVGLLVFLLWLGIWLGPNALGTVSRGARAGIGLPPDALRLIQLGVAVLLAAGVTMMWMLPKGSLSLGLSPAEIELLSSAPIRRRELIQYAIVKNQTGILFGAAIMTLVMGSGGPASRLLWFVTFWLILTNGDLHGKGRTLVWARLRELPRTRARALVAAGIVVGVSYWTVLIVSLLLPVRRLVAEVPGAIEGGMARDLMARAATDLSHGVHRWLLAPLLWLLEPGLATLGAGSGVVAVGGCLVFGLALALAQNEWVVRSQFKFEESALEHARRESAKKDPRSRYRRISRGRRTQVPFDLSPRGAPGLGLLWKNLLQVRRGSIARNLGIGALLAVAVGVVPTLAGSPAWVPRTLVGIGFAFLIMAGWVMPLQARNDLRSDLLRLEVIRPWPVPGWQVFGWEVLGPAIEGTLTAVVAVCLIVSADLATRIREGVGAPAAPLSGMGLEGATAVPLLVLGLLPVVVTLAFLTATWVNLVVLYMPGWVSLGPHKAKGAAAFGHNILLSLGLLLSHSVVLAVGALLVGLVLVGQIVALRLPLAAWELPFLGVLAALPVAAAAALGVRVGGALWERLDASREVLDQAG